MRNKIAEQENAKLNKARHMLIPSEHEDCLKQPMKTPVTTFQISLIYLKFQVEPQARIEQKVLE